jgi:hypothetical protein
LVHEREEEGRWEILIVYVWFTRWGERFYTLIYTGNKGMGGILKLGGFAPPV